MCLENLTREELKNEVQELRIEINDKNKEMNNIINKLESLKELNKEKAEIISQIDKKIKYFQQKSNEVERENKELKEAIIAAKPIIMNYAKELWGRITN